MKWNHLSIGQKNAVGFGIVLLLLASLSLVSYMGVAGIVGNASQVIEGNKLDGELAQKEVDHLNWVANVNALLTDDTVKDLNVQTDDHKCGFGAFLFGEGRKQAEESVPTLAPLFKEIEEPHKSLHKSAISISNVFKQADHDLPTVLADKIIDHLRWANKVREAMTQWSETLGVEVDPENCALGKWMNSGQARNAYENGNENYRKEWNELVSVHKTLHRSAAEINGFLSPDSSDGDSFQKAEKVYKEKTLPALSLSLDLLTKLKTEANNDLKGMIEASSIYSKETFPALTKVQGLLHQLREEARKHIMTDQTMLESAQKTREWVVILSILAIVLGVVLAYVISRNVVTILTSITDRMNSVAEQVADASGQVSQSSQSLAEGSSEQASAIEETSASLEQMSSMIRLNAENAGKADDMMKDANKVLEKANQSMTGLTGAMNDMSRASQETSKIIKTIDEIAFQTNLLALNAAVEAARAGVAGAGFAVVADEVRNLALRAAQAAKNTSELIEGTVRKIDEGGRLVTSTGEAFTEVSQVASKVGGLINEISNASAEQAEGIGQLNKAIVEMDKVIQVNAANAEETASASEEMNAQAQAMEDAARDLKDLVHGHKKVQAQESAGRYLAIAANDNKHRPV